MKATNNNTDTLFMDIFVELFAIAKVYFQELFKNVDPGTYTIREQSLPCNTRTICWNLFLSI